MSILDIVLKMPLLPHFLVVWSPNRTTFGSTIALGTVISCPLRHIGIRIKRAFASKSPADSTEPGEGQWTGVRITHQLRATSYWGRNLDCEEGGEGLNGYIALFLPSVIVSYTLKHLFLLGGWLSLSSACCIYLRT